jgi:hypothetical protein
LSDTSQLVGCVILIDAMLVEAQIVKTSGEANG